MSSIIDVDENGDLASNFSAPYRHRHSSRYLTVAALCVPSGKKHIPKREIRKLYVRFDWQATIEKKWQHMIPRERLAFARYCPGHVRQPQNIDLPAIVRTKERMEAPIKSDHNQRYNSMIRLCVLDCMAKQDEAWLFLNHA